MRKIDEIEGVFFDCWDTLLEFHMPNPYWNIQTLKDHAYNSSSYDWNEIYEFSESFFKDYYFSRLRHELKVEQILELIKRYFSLKLDYSIEQCTHEILTQLAPKPVMGASEFLSYLKTHNVPFACLSNTVYPMKDTKELLEKHLGHEFPLVLASCDIGVKKPNPLFFKTGVREMGLNVENCIYIGDKLVQDCYGSYLSGFYRSVYLNWKDDLKKQLKTLKDTNTPEFEYLEVDCYSTLMEKLNHDGI
jgi:putative hydrolase of the HAD superfamily